MSREIEIFEALLRDKGGAGVTLAPPPELDGTALAEAVKRLALEDLPRALAIVETFDQLHWSNPRQAAHLLAARAHVLLYANRFDDAGAALEQAADLARRSGNHADVGQVELAAIQLHARQGRLAEAESAACRALGAYREADDPIAQGKALLNLGIVQRMRERPDEALDSFDQAAALVSTDAFLSGALASNRAEALLDLDRFRDAEAAFEIALASFLAAGREHAAAIVEGNLADLLSREGRLDEALERFEPARRRFEHSGATADAMRLAAEEAEALGALGAHEAALNAYAQCIPGLESAGLARELCRARSGLALTLLSVGSTHDAQNALQRCRAEWESLGSVILPALCDAALAALHIKAEEWEQAETLADRASAALCDRPARLARCHADLASAWLDAGRLDRAAEAIAEVDRLAGIISLVPVRISALHLRGRLALAQNRPKDAASLLQQALAETERLRSVLRAEQHRMAFGESWRRLYLDACHAALETGDTAMAFDALERLRSRTLLEALGSGMQITTGPQSPDASVVQEEYHTTLEGLNILYSRLGSGISGSETPADLSALVDLERTADRLRERLQATAGTVGNTADPLSLQSVQSALPDGAACLSYFEDEGHLSVIIVTRDAARVTRRLCRLDEALQQARRVRFFADRLTEDPADHAAARSWHSALERYGRTIFSPLRATLEGHHRIGIALFGDLQEVPPAAVPVNGRQLADTCTITVLPGLSAAIRLSAPDFPAKPTVLAVGVADEAAPRMEEEARRVASPFPGASVLTGAEATTEAVLAALPHADLVHLSTHHVHSDLHPMSSRLRLTDRWVTARELVAHIRPGCRIVLAGCESGRSGGGNVEDRLGIVRALLARGVREVAASLTPLHDATAARLFAALYEHLAAAGRTATLAGALRAAQGDLEKEGVPAWLWGPMTVTGGLR